MAQQGINIGSAPSGAGGDTPRTAWIKANANFSELYGLTGKGGIIESGSNSNGTYVKYVDGSMECWGISANAVAINSSGGSVFHSGVAYGFNFAVGFSNVPSIVVSALTTNGYYCWAAQDGGASTTGFACRGVSPANGVSCYLCYIAKGRWK